MSSRVEKSELPLLSDLRKQLKLDAKDEILSCLTRLKSDSKCYKQFAKDGGLHILVNLLRYQNSKIVNMSLSILANACMVADAREKVRGSKIAPNVLRIVKNTKVGDALHCRACRLIGNLSECSWHAKSLCDMGAVQALSALLQLETSLQTYLMAVRAVRNIWNYHQDSRNKIVSAGTIKTITALLVTAKEKADSTNARYSELTDVCLKALYAFLGTFDPRCGDQMRGETDAQGYKCIIQCCEANNNMAIKCLYNLCQIAECRLVLGTSGAVESLILLIRNNSQLCKETLASLCFFCREAVNRARVRIASGLELMLSLLKQSENERYHPILLYALTEFIYDDPSIAIMVKNGLLDVLVARLTQMVNEISVEKEEKETSRKRSNDSPPNRRGELKYLRTNFGRLSLDYQRDDWSPGSSTSMSSSPPSTPPLPCYDTEDVDENAEDNYSPVCSDTEWSENEEELHEEVESLKSGISTTVVDVEETCEDTTYSKSQLASTNSYANVWTLILLSRLSHSTYSIDRLADPTIIRPLSDYIRRAKNPRASRILTRIVRNGAYLMPLLKQGFFFEAETLYGSEQYTRQLCALAETGGAIGEITTILLRGEEAHKLMIAVSIPFLIKSRYLLWSLLKNYGGLQMIFRVLEDRDHVLWENAVWSICRLANTLQIRPDCGDRYQTLSSLLLRITESGLACGMVSDLDSGLSKGPKPATVTFELDDGTTVDACRQTLCQRSDVFFAMLEGNFSESGKRRVKLRNTSQEGLHTLLLAASGAEFDDRSIESLLDAVLLADKFLMPDISDLLTECSLAKLNHNNLSRAWNWARENLCHEFRSCCVKTFLTANMTRGQRVHAFRDFSAGEKFYEFLEEVREIVNTVLCQR